MTDELDRIRSLHDAAPGPSREWVDDTRAQLLAMAADEEEATGEASEAAPGLLARLRRRVAELVDVAAPVAWAGAAAVVVAVVAVVAVLGRSPSPDPPVAGPTDRPEPTADTTTPDDTVVLASSCTGPDGAYTVDYPEGWHTNPGDVTAPCQLFGEEPVEVEEQAGGAPTTPVVVRVLPVSFDRATESGPASRELSRETTTVAGSDAVRVERESTGEAALPEGVRMHQWFVRLGEQRTLMLAAYSGIGPADFDQYRQVVDEMARTLELPPTD